MSIPFSFIFKQKKIVIPIFLLFLIIIGLIVPNLHPASAVVRLCTDTSLFANVPGSGWLTDSLSLPEATMCWIMAIVKLPATLINYVGAFINLIFGIILNWVIRITLDMNYTRIIIGQTTPVSIGWPIVRNFANMAIVMGFITIAVATILRIKEYEAKALLTRLIIATLLVNFSLVICGFFIDISRVALNSFGVARLAPNTEIFDAIGERLLDLNTGFIDSIFLTLGDIVSYCLEIITSILFIFLFLARVIAIWILVILSPLAFVCYVFPITKGMVFDKWWSNFIQWCFVGVFGMFFLYIGREIRNAGTISFPINAFDNMDDISGLGEAINNILRNKLTILLAAIVPSAFMIIGFIFSLQMSAMGSKVAIGAFKSSGKYVRKAGKWGADKTGLTKRAQALGDRVSRGLERAGILEPGTTVAQQRDRGKEALADKDRRSRIEAMSRDERIAELRANRSGLEAGYDRAAIMEEMGKDGEIHDGLPGGLSAAEVEQFGTEANVNGARAKKIAEDDYQMAEYDQSRVDEYIRTEFGGVDNPANRLEAKGAIRRQQLEDNVGSMKRKNMKGVNPADLTPEVVTGDAFNPSVIRKFQDAPDAIKDAIRNAVTAIGGINEQLSGLLSPDDDSEIRRLNNLRIAIGKYI